MREEPGPVVHRLLRSSHDIFRTLDLPNGDVDEDVSSSIQLIERASVIVNDLFVRATELERSLDVLNQEIAERRNREADMAQRLVIAEEAISSQTARADRCEKLLSSSYEKVKTLEQRNQNLRAQIERMVSVVSKSLSIAAMPTREDVGTYSSRIAS